MPKISVIIPVCNVEKFLPECLDSILKQTIKDIEIICINDGSTDNSSDILNEYRAKDDRFIIINQSNSGPSISRNKGVEAANGEFIAFIDSDDFLINDDYFEKLLNACEKYNADIAVASILRGNEKKSEYILKIDEEKFSAEYSEKLLICDVPNLNFVWNKLYRRESLLSTGLVFPEHKIYEDLFYTPQVLFYMNKLVSVPDAVYFYRNRSNSIIKTRNKKAEDDYNYCREQVFKFFKEHNIDASYIMKKTKKYKLFGLTYFKKEIQYNICKNTLLNFIKWKS